MGVAVGVFHPLTGGVVPKIGKVVSGYAGHKKSTGVSTGG